MKTFFTSESVTEGHPDKLCDQVSDAVLDAILEKDPAARVACEVATTTGLILVMGEITTTAYVPIDQIARQVALDIGYDRAKYGFDGHTCSVLTAVHEQSPDIAGGVNTALEVRKDQDSLSQDELSKAPHSGKGFDQTQTESEIGAGDQGMMFGYACDETPELMPLPITLAHRLAQRLAQVRKSEMLPWLRPDGKTQVTVEYENGKPVRVDSVLVSAQHSPDVAHAVMTEGIIKEVIKPSIDASLLDERTRFLVNPSGRFVIGGPNGDSGLTGRKIIVDSYGGMGRHGGGAFSGKDPTKVDRSAAYAARHVAKNIVAAGLAARCEVALSYAIGVARPLSLRVDTFGTDVITEEKLARIVSELFDLSPSAIIRDMNLRRPIYRQIACYGHFGRDDLDLPWEKLNRVDDLRRLAGV